MEKKAVRKARKPQSAKGKGRRLQQRVVAMIEEAFEGRLRWGDVRSLSMGAAGEDILMSPHAASLLGVTIEAKNVEDLSLAAAYRQSCAHQRGAHGREPVVVFSRNRETVYIAIALDHELAHRPPRIRDARGMRNKVWDLLQHNRAHKDEDLGLVVRVAEKDLLVCPFAPWLVRQAGR